MRFDTHVSLIHTSSRVPILIMAIHLTTAKRLGLSMRSNTSMKRDHGNQPSGLLKYAAIGGLLFLHFPILFIFLYAFTSESKSYQFPPPA